MIERKKGCSRKLNRHCGVCNKEIPFDAEVVVDVCIGLEHFCYFCSLNCMFAYDAHPQYKKLIKMKNAKKV